MSIWCVHLHPLLVEAPTRDQAETWALLHGTVIPRFVESQEATEEELRDGITVSVPNVDYIADAALAAVSNANVDADPSPPISPVAA